MQPNSHDNSTDSRADSTSSESSSTSSDAGRTDGGTGRRTLREERSLTPMRKTIAKRLSESYQNAVHVTVSRRIDAAELLAYRSDWNDQADSEISTVDILLRALGETLEEHPGFNATFEEGTHRLYQECNIGIATDIHDGLVTPVLEDVGAKSIEQIARERQKLVDRVRDGEYTMSDFEGGTFTLSNLGPLGVDSFTPIINPPEVAILGLGQLTERPHQSDGEVVFRPELPANLSIDHRVVDGADGARFLDTLASHLQNPERIRID